MSDRAVPEVRRQFGPRLRGIRKAKQLSQEGLGQRAGISGKFVGEVERGEKSISLDTLTHVARAVGTPLEVLVRGVDGRSCNVEAEKVYALLLAKKSSAIAKARVLQVVTELVG